MKNDRGVASDTDLTAEDLQELVDGVQGASSPRTSRRRGLPRRSWWTAPCRSRRTPWCSCSWPSRPSSAAWNNPRAVLYRKKNKIADDLGTAVNVQSMVFGNKGNTSATGVAFTRNPANGEQRVLRRLPGERPGRGRRGRHPQHEPHRRSQDTSKAWKRPAPQLEEIFVAAGEPLPRHVRHRVHHRAGQALDAADPRGQAHRRGRAAHRHRDGEGRPHHQGGGRHAASPPTSSTSCCTRSSTRTPPTTWWPAA